MLLKYYKLVLRIRDPEEENIDGHSTAWKSYEYIWTPSSIF